ncbi:MAG TPA: GntR family transcriptional regulator [Candidatus Binatia bacterium]|nr:GntR family transcriptional regulator [Candidatus Binatia bacterium]
MSVRLTPARKSSTRPRRAGVLRNVTPQSLRDRAYDAIKHHIITCAFKPGEYLNEAAVCAQLQLGRTPVHQAVDRLRLEGMVEVLPRKGMIVKPVSLHDILEIIEVRLVNECYCVRLAAERADRGELEAMTQVLTRARKATRARDVEEMMMLDREFHTCVARAAKNALLGDFLRRLHERSLRFWFISLTDPAHHTAVRDEHEAVLAALQKRSPDDAEAAMRAHIESFRRNVSRHL